MNNNANATCNRCGSPLIQLTQAVEALANMQSSTKTTTYRCSDPVCQQQIDKKLEEMRQRRAEQAEREAAKAVIAAEKKLISQAAQAAAKLQTAK